MKPVMASFWQGLQETRVHTQSIFVSRYANVDNIESLGTYNIIVVLSPGSQCCPTLLLLPFNLINHLQYYSGWDFCTHGQPEIDMTL